MSCNDCDNQVVHTIQATEDSTADYEFDLIDQAGLPVPLSAVTAWTLTLTNLADGTIINGRNAVDILNAAGGTFDSDGHGTLELSPADNPILGNASTIVEEHRALFHLTWNAGLRGKWWYARIKVRAVPGVTS